MWRAVLLVTLLTFSAAAREHSDVRRFVIQSHLAQAGEGAIVFIGDSITESALLPNEMCGAHVVNAGVGGTTVSEYLDSVISGIPQFRASAIVIALGTNDAKPNASTEEFRLSYAKLLQALREYAPKIVLVGIPPLERGLRDPEIAAALNEQVKAIATRDSLRFIDLQAAMIGNGMTIDGIHLSPLGYQHWLSAIDLCP